MVALRTTNQNQVMPEDTGFLHLRKDSPLRPTDWRWQRARVMRSDPRLAGLMRKDDDNFTHQAREYQTARSRCVDNYQLYKLTDRYYHLWLADDVFMRPGDGKRVRAEMEARLLAGEEYASISHRCCVPVPTVTWYEALFFNVNDRLENKGYIAQVVIGEKMQFGLTERDYEVLWKMYGYIGKKTVLDAVINQEMTDQARSFMADDAKDSNYFKTSKAGRMLPVNSYTQATIYEIHQNYEQLRLEANKGTGQTNQMTDNILAAMGCLRWAVGDSKQTMKVENKNLKVAGKISRTVLEFDASAAELRADELMRIESGQDTSDLQSLKEIRYPEARNDQSQADDHGD